MSDADAPPLIDASPTKEFFINILVRDVTLSQAISELVDNSIDGAKRIRRDRNFKGLQINIQFDKSHFLIEDNCGGIPIDVAANYAFRFGRIEGGPTTPLPVGQFGVGMKRALFKIGRFITINSVARDSSFLLEIDVDIWKTKSEWQFEFKESRRRQRNSLGKCGTKIEVTRLHDHTIADFLIDNFFNRLVESIQSQNAEPLQKGLKIIINGTPLNPPQAALVRSKSIKPIHVSKTIKQEIIENGKKVNKKVEVELYAGIGEPILLDAGWYVFCNGRLILKADRTPITGWGVDLDAEAEAEEVREGGRTKKIPKAHYQFARFRGYVYFNSNDASLLPWNTTKSGIDIGSPVYQAIKWNMIAAMRQVIDFLNKLKEEKDRDETYLADLISHATESKVSDIPRSAKFVYPILATRKIMPKTQRISYVKSIEEFRKASKLLGISASKDVGEKTFDYFLNMEGDADA
jgi:hypothetical protein